MRCTHNLLVQTVHLRRHGWRRTNFFLYWGQWLSALYRRQVSPLSKNSSRQISPARTTQGACSCWIYIYLCSSSITKSAYRFFAAWVKNSGAGRTVRFKFSARLIAPQLYEIGRPRLPTGILSKWKRAPPVRWATATRAADSRRGATICIHQRRQETETDSSHCSSSKPAAQRSDSQLEAKISKWVQIAVLVWPLTMTTPCEVANWKKLHLIIIMKYFYSLRE